VTAAVVTAVVTAVVIKTQTQALRPPARTKQRRPRFRLAALVRVVSVLV